METQVLELIFLDSYGSKFTLSLEDPRMDLSENEIEEVMQTIIEQNVFTTTKMGDLITIHSARIVTRHVDEILEYKNE